jgi:uncharacterized protein YecT (DUF1311 family)
MKFGTLILFVLVALTRSHGQTVPQDVTPAQLQAVIGLPLDQAVQRRETYKGPLKSAFARQMALSGKDCQSKPALGQQQYNICIGRADEEADKDFAVFYNNLQMLCHNQDQLAAMHDSEKSWENYRESAMKAAHAAWPDGTGAPGFAGGVYLSLIRDRMRELNEIYGLNIAQ